MQLDIISPEKDLYTGDVNSVVVPAVDGSLGILNNHAPLISTLQGGNVEIIDEKGTSTNFVIKGGVVEVLKNKVVILAD
jgi:F-type H+-transporting ATPase subunit epsilon